MTHPATTPAPDPLHQPLAAAPPGTLAVAADGALARALLEEASWSAGGVLLPLPGGGWALVGAAEAPARRAAGFIAGLGGAPPRLLALPEGGASLLAPSPAPPPPVLPRLRLLLDAEGVAWGQLLSPGAGEREEACRALLRGLAHDPPPLRPGLRLFLECPEEDRADAPGGQGGSGGRAPVAVLPLVALSRPAALRARRDVLARSGWDHGLIGPDAEALGWMDGGEPWALAPPGPVPPAVLPQRLVLLGPRPAWAPRDALHEAAT
ncbi:hypothetical protein [Sabulicella glaciei]|uniref:Uncharacterized protein n=1 Tax=Sabulicella glaciei TaxID=2984948 RepID=A0ABT3P2W3_9PROT|nr:hypothetical protein [Roseococcus sp. MDT2-1-1]MCW8088119.1 hypothetical protein [Roseococcus sp. MDT2-1-1]